MKLKKQIELELSCGDLEITPSELAQIFTDKDAQYQAEFFNWIAEHVKQWEAPFCFQMQSITDNAVLTDDARKIMSDIGDYSSKEIPTN